MRSRWMLVYFLGLILSVPALRAAPVDSRRGGELLIPPGVPITVDGIIAAGEWSGVAARTIAPEHGRRITVLIKHDERNLYVAFTNLEQAGGRLYPEILIRADASTNPAWQKEDWWFHASQIFVRQMESTMSTTETASFCVPTIKPDWNANNPPARGVVEFQISLVKLGLVRNAKFRIAFVATDATGDAKQRRYFWPAASGLNNPATWSDATLSE